MTAYWSVCAVLGSVTGFFAALARPPVHPPPTPLLVAAVVATLAPQPFYWAAVAPASKAAGRRLSVPAIAAFAAVNALLETAAFDAAARAGVAVAAAVAPAVPRALAAFTSLSAYCGLIHALFWESVFPLHLPAPGTRAAALMRVALALFGPMTAAWCGLLLWQGGGGGVPWWGCTWSPTSRRGRRFGCRGQVEGGGPGNRGGWGGG